MSRPSWSEGPTADQIYKAIPTSQFQAVWNESFPSVDDCYECGGWFYADPANKTNLEIVRAPNGDKVPQKVETTNPAAIDLNRPHPSKSHPTWVLVGNFHTHPLAAAVKGNQEPSRADKELAWERQVPGIVISREGFFKYGEDEREDLRQPQEYPPKPTGSMVIRTPKKIAGAGRPDKAPNQWNVD